MTGSAEFVTADVGRDVPLAPYTTLGIGGPARQLIEVGSSDEFTDAVASADSSGEDVLVLGGGSNVVVPDGGFSGTVVRVCTRGVDVVTRGSCVEVRVQAGEDWEPFVARCVGEGLAGIECLSGIPGLVGATPIQNVGAYGQEISETVAAVRAYDRRAGEAVQLRPDECGFAYRTSAFKRDDRYAVLDVTLRLWRSPYSAPIRYAELARVLGVGVGERVPLADARAAVLELRRGKGMVLDPDDGDTASAGSFFTNPILDGRRLAELQRRVEQRLGTGVQPPRYPAGDGHTKVSAAWLIERAGFHKGYRRGPARISTKHTLALTNPEGWAGTADLLALAREVRDGVRDAFGVQLQAEPVLLGCDL